MLGGHLDAEWATGVDATPVDRDSFVRNQLDEPWPHQREGVKIPMPTGRLLAAMEREAYQRVEGEGLGPETSAWVRSVYAWARRLKARFFGQTKQVTGLWSRAVHRWKARLSLLEDKVLARRVLREVRFGVRLPFDETPTEPIVAPCNHSELSVRAEQVFQALEIQLQEGSIEPFDVSEVQRPMCVMSLRWVEKSNPEVVRLTLNGRPLNPSFPRKGKECTIELETHRELRAHYRPGQLHVGYDLHNGKFPGNFLGISGMIWSGSGS